MTNKFDYLKPKQIKERKVIEVKIPKFTLVDRNNYRINVYEGIWAIALFLMIMMIAWFFAILMVSMGQSMLGPKKPLNKYDIEWREKDAFISACTDINKSERGVPDVSGDKWTCKK